MATQVKTIILTIVRHGATDANKQGIAHGSTDTPLNNLGLRQAKAAGQALKDMTFHQAYSSDLQRAHKTCQIILEENQKSAITSANIIQDKLLQERDHGNFEGMKWIDFKPLMDKNFEFKSDCGFNGESTTEFYNRVQEFLKKVTKESVLFDENLPNILIVAHGGSIHQLLPAMFAEIKTEVPENIDLRNGLKKNTAYLIMKMEVSINDFAIASVECEKACNAAHLENL